MEKYRILVEEEIKKLTASIAYLDTETRPIEPSVSLGRLTRMEAIQEKSINESVQRDNKNRLSRLYSALERIKKGEYGNCLKCKAPISEGRLEAVPDSLFCLHCAEKASASSGPA